MKFRKKPIVIEAVQWTGKNIDEITAFIPLDDRLMLMPVNTPDSIKEAQLNVRTKEGLLHASPGDFIIRGVQGEFYPCKPDIFAATYDAVSE